MALGWALIWGTALIWGKTGSYMFSEVSYRSGTMLDLYIATIPDKRL